MTRLAPRLAISALGASALLLAAAVALAALSAGHQLPAGLRTRWTDVVVGAAFLTFPVFGC